MKENNYKATNTKYIIPENLPDNILSGDMPRDKPVLSKELKKKAQRIFGHLSSYLDRTNKAKLIITVFGGSGSGKTALATYLAHCLSVNDIACRVLAGDNYPHLIPQQNDQRRREVYEEYGASALAAYLGSAEEIDYEAINRVISDFKSGKEKTVVRKMRETAAEIWQEEFDCRDVRVLLIDWTHGKSPLLAASDLYLFLASTVEETLSYRRQRKRDEDVAGSFTNLVLTLEQQAIETLIDEATLIFDREGELVSYRTYKRKQAGKD